MKRSIFLLALCCLGKLLSAQYVYTIKADSVKITNNCDTAELIIENHTQNVAGFLYNKGKGRTEFRQGLVKINDSIYLVGNDTLKMKNGFTFNPWLQGGNAFGASGYFGTTDSNHVDFYTNNIFRGRLTANGGKLLLGTATDNGEKLQVNGSIFTSTGTIKSNGGVSIPATISFIGNQDAGNVFVGHYYPPAWSSHLSRNVMIQTNQNIQSNLSKQFQITIGGLNTDSSTKNYGMIIGSLNKQLDGSYYGGTIIGHSNSYFPSGSSVAGDIIIGNGNVYSGHSSIILGAHNKTSLSNVFIAAGNRENGQGGISNVFFGNGVRADTGNNAGNGLSYIINGSGASTNQDRNGGNITLAGGKGTGAGTPGNIIFSTATPTTTGITLQSLSERARFAGASGNFLIGTTNDNGYTLQVNGTGWFGNELRVYHPTFATGGIGGGMRWLADNTFYVFGGPGESLKFGPSNEITSSSTFIAPTFYATTNNYGDNYYVPTGGGVYNTSGFPGNVNYIFHKFTNKLPGTNTGNGSPTLMELNKLVNRGDYDALEIGLRIKFTVTGVANYLRALETVNGDVKLNTTSGLTSIGLDSATAATSKLDVNGAQGYNQLRLRKNYTPTSSSDTNGNTGDVSWDDNYFYIKTSAGWKRAALSTF